jgi:hypothetical protein
MTDVLKLVYRRALAAADPDLVQVSFAVELLTKYRDDAGFSVIRTDSAGRVRRAGGWSVDFGIAPDEHTIHASWRALAYAVPQDEREYWALHAAAPSGYSENFLRMQLAPGSCFDDGDVRTW